MEAYGGLDDAELRRPRKDIRETLTMKGFALSRGNSEAVLQDIVGQEIYLL